MSKLLDWVALRGKLQADLQDYFARSQRDSQAGFYYALADCGQIPEFQGSGLDKLHASYIRLFSRTTESNIQDFGPVLISIDPGSTQLELPVNALLKAMKHGWTVSWIRSSLPANELANHLINYLDGRFEDGSSVLLRYYDPRLLPEFLSIIGDSYRKALLAPIVEWCFWDRKLGLRVSKGSGLQKIPKVHEVKISELERDLMGRAALPDLIMSNLLEEADESEFAKWLPHALYQAVHIHIEKAQKQGLKDIADLQLFTSLAIGIHPDFHLQIPEFISGLPKLGIEDDSLSDLVLKVPDHHWDALETSGQQALQDLRLSINHELQKKTDLILEN